MAKWCNVVTHEIHKARTEDWNFQNPSAKVTLQVKNTLSKNAARDLLQYRRPYPFNKGVTADLFAVSVSPVMDKARFTTDMDMEIMDYTYDAFITVTYNPLYGKLYNVYTFVIPQTDGLVYVEENFEPDLQFMTFDYRKFRYKGEVDTFERGSEGGWPVYREKVMRSVKGYITPPNVTTWEGSYHSYPYTSDITGRTYGADTLLCTNVKITQGHWNYFYAQPTYNVSAELIYQKEGWTKFSKLDCDSGNAKIEYKEVEALCDPKDDTSWKDFLPYTSMDLKDFIFDKARYPASLYDPNIWIGP
jgi:hypothetical protein